MQLCVLMHDSIHGHDFCFYCPLREVGYHDVLLAVQLLRNVLALQLQQFSCSGKMIIGKLHELSHKQQQVKVSLARTESHLDFSEICLSNGHTPHGLLIPIQCHAFQKDATPVAQQFKETIKKNSRKLTTIFSKPLPLAEGKPKPGSW